MYLGSISIIGYIWIQIRWKWRTPNKEYTLPWSNISSSSNDKRSVNIHGNTNIKPIFVGTTARIKNCKKIQLKLSCLFPSKMFGHDRTWTCTLRDGTRTRNVQIEGLMHFPIMRRVALPIELHGRWDSVAGKADLGWKVSTDVEMRNSEMMHSVLQCSVEPKYMICGMFWMTFYAFGISCPSDVCFCSYLRECLWQACYWSFHNGCKLCALIAAAPEYHHHDDHHSHKKNTKHEQ